MTDPEVLRTLSRIEQKVDRLLTGIATTGATSGGTPADDGDLDGPYGDEEIRAEPKYWKGERYAGKRMSECPPDYLDALAKMFDAWYERSKNDPKWGPKAHYKLKSAARARGWAARIREVGSFGRPEDQEAKIPF